MRVYLLFGIIAATLVLFINAEETQAETNTQKEEQEEKFKSPWHIWDYKGVVGPQAWGVNFKECRQDGTEYLQSPIDIKESETTVASALSPINWIDEHKLPKVMAVVNDGRLLRLDVTPRYTTTIIGGGLGANFRLYSIQFHWGSQDDQGSDHLLNGRHSPMEVQFWHFDTEYGTFPAAGTTQKGLVSVTYHVKITDEDNEAYAPIFNALKSVPNPGNFLEIEPFHTKTLMTEDRTDYYMYHGSVPYPPCLQSAIWVIMRERLTFSRRQLDLLRTTLKDSRGEPLVDNFRPVQSGKQAKVFYHPRNLEEGAKRIEKLKNQKIEL